MHFTELYPPGTVIWATALVRSICSRVELPGHNPSQPQPLEDIGTIPELNLYEVKKVEAVFSQVTFAQDMLRYLRPSDKLDCTDDLPSSHMPHTYDRVLHELL
jgi:hypothetical protein